MGRPEVHREACLWGNEMQAGFDGHGALGPLSHRLE